MRGNIYPIQIVLNGHCNAFVGKGLPEKDKTTFCFRIIFCTVVLVQNSTAYKSRVIIFRERRFRNVISQADNEPFLLCLTPWCGCRFD